MRVEESMVETYVRFVKKWFTIANIKCKNNKEIDLLAIDLQGNKYHIEVKTLTDGWPLEIKEDGRKNIETLEKFRDKKFLDKNVKEKIKEFFGDDNYKRILVYWKVNTKNRSFEEIKKIAKDNYSIDNIWLMPKIVDELSKDKLIKENIEVIRTIRLLTKAQKEIK